MKSMRFLTFVAAARAVVAGEAVHHLDAAIEQAYAPAMAARDDCTKLPALCTGAVTVSGTGMTLTYLCPTTSQVLVSTVHVTVTATTTVTSLPESSAVVDTPHGPVGLGSTEILPTGTPHPPAPPSKNTEVTSTTTIHSTLTTSKTVTVTRKTSSPSAGVPSLTTPTPTRVIPSVMPPFTLVTPSASHNASSATTTLGSEWFDLPFTKPSDWPSGRPFPTGLESSSTGTAPFNLLPVPTSIATRGFGILPITRNATASRGYTFPTPHVVREIESSESAKPSKTGGAGNMGVNIAALIGGAVAAAYLA